MMIRPVIDPAIPVEVRDALLAHAEGLRPGSGTLSLVLPGGRRQTARDVVRALQDRAICTISVNGAVISRAMTRKYLGQAVCQTAIP